MKKLILIVALFISGCTTVPVKQDWPQLPVELSKDCPSLLLLEGDEVKLSQLMTVVAKNYGLYHECAGQMNAIIEWHRRQMEILNSVK